MPKVSVVIATYNRSKSLSCTLDSIMSQEIDNDMFNDYEVIIVDNNSSDNTKETIYGYSKKFPDKIRYLFEPRQGKSYALNLGIENSKGDILAFTDDDVIVDKEWLKNITIPFLNFNCDAVGGMVLPVFLDRAPRWIKREIDMLRGPFVYYAFGKETKAWDSHSMSPFIGANVAFKKHIFKTIGLFKTDIGRGTDIPSEDSELFKRVVSCGMSLYYCGSAIVWHKIEKNQLTKLYVAKWFFDMGRYYARMDIINSHSKMIALFGMPRYLLKDILKNVFFLLLSIGNSKKIVKYWSFLCQCLGKFYEYKEFGYVKTFKINKS